MDKSILEQYVDAKKEYEDTKRRLKQTEESLQKYDKNYQVKDSVSGGAGGTEHFVIKGFPYPEYTRKKTLMQRRKLRLDKLKKELEVMIDEVEQYIDTVDDPRKRLILRYKYIDGLTWAEVAKKLGPGNNVDSIRIEIDRFLKK